MTKPPQRTGEPPITSLAEYDLAAGDMTKDLNELSPPEMADFVWQYLKTLPKPQVAKCSPEIRTWFETQALPTLKNHALSELHRKDACKPMLVSFRDSGGMAVVDVQEAMGGDWGDSESKDHTARVHQISAMVPSVKASVFCVEAWVVRNVDPKELEEHMKTGIKDHPDRGEVIMFHMIHYDHANNALMQLTTMIEVLKVFSADRDPETWSGTKFGTEEIVDPHGDDDLAFRGRFIAGDQGDKP